MEEEIKSVQQPEISGGENQEKLPTEAAVNQLPPQTSGYALRPPKDQSLAFILEILPGLFGFLGLGWIYSGNTLAGILWLAGMLIWDLFVLVMALFTLGLSCICTLPVNLILLAVSSALLYQYIKQHPELFVGVPVIMQQPGAVPVSDEQPSEMPIAARPATVAQPVVRESTAAVGIVAIDSLIAALQGPDKGKRRAAARALGQTGDARAVEPLIAALGDSNRDVRKESAAALGQLGDFRAVGPLIATLKDTSLSLRAITAKALGQIGDAQAVGPLIALLEDKNHDVRQEATGALGRIGDPRAVGPLIAALRKEEHIHLMMGSPSIQALVRIGAPAVESLIPLLQDKSPAVTAAAALVLEQIGDAGAVGPLVEALPEAERALKVATENYDDFTHESILVRTLGRALIQIGGPAVGPLIAALRAGKTEDVPAEAIIALVGIGELAVDPLITANQKDGVRPTAALLLDDVWAPPGLTDGIAAARREQWYLDKKTAGLRQNRPSGMPSLFSVTHDESLWVAVHKDIKNLAQHLGPLMVALIAILKSETQSEREAAQMALDQIGAPVVEMLATVVLQDPEIDAEKHYPNRKAAARLLGQMGAQDPACRAQAVGALSSALKSQDTDVRKEAAAALGQIGDEQAVGALEIVLNDKDRGVRKAASKSLDRIGKSESV
ncbi:MAG: HEAT repeat domain-containing protein [Chloroflexi bacterium]|nr:HEAT repeat domain-containing protein [Chloroflexota bacterium]MBU1749919.1 HEAT repeat domain-containing protein [Chloroflexota bacterium]MBU1879333.1 HEAT repeat domain-containing protein [Chloroflexota bacterium]